MSDTLSTTSTFAPSELVLLFGDRFAGPGSAAKGKEELLTGAGTVATNDLGENVLVAAFLALEEAGLLRLEQRTRKALFGLLKSQTVFAVPTGTGHAWSAGSIEARLLAAVGRGETEVEDVVYAFFGDDQGWPRAWVLEQVKEGLLDRGLLGREEVKKMKIFTSTRYTLPEPTREMLRGESADGVQALLRAAEGRGPGFLAALRKRIGAGLSRRTERSSGDGDYGDSSSD